MSTDASDADADALKERVETWLTKQMPIIQMHGGTSAVREADPETGEVIIELGGGCAGCGVADVTTSNIESELYQWEEITDVTVRVPDPDDALGGDREDGSIMGIDRREGGRGSRG
jgi:Fe/S biogenesis protein NfuA